MRRGFTMIEVMVAGAILAIGCLGILGMLLTTMNYNRQASLRTQAVTLAEQQLASLEVAASDAANWNDSASGIIRNLRLRSQSNGGGWVSPDRLIVNVNGADPGSNSLVPPAQFALSYYVLEESPDYPHADYLRGSIRVIWNRNANGNCLKADSIAAMDTLNSTLHKDCGFVSLPFALKR